ncbi:hypothetical protein CEE37_06745 [candidate division LCP-89 bacterium B3_LCP]|uniref:Uncharacterized protein n=1 Tax=candidate division LCP-89 bacterium B3_LCP TaxID=2012998 RepID=A0A532V0B4_UNCL8|nr:MAG: hypothetical protein CEE37_06745 [candidate division LCP-89 bacterium B3_LCP]
MIEFLLRELEKTQRPVFSKNELTSISCEQFKDLVNKNILTFKRPKYTDVERIRQPRCPHGCYLTVVEYDGELEAFCDEHLDVDPISIDEDDLLRYTFLVEDLLELIAQVNELQGSLQKIAGGFFYLGQRTVSGKRIGLVFTRLIDSNQFVKFLGLKDIFIQDEILLVFAPISLIEDIDLRSRLIQKNIVLTTFFETLNFNSLKLPIGELATELDKLDVAIAEETFNYSPDYLTVEIKGKTFHMNDTQADVIKYLHNAHKTGYEWVKQKEVMIEIFRTPNGDESAFWHKLSSIFKTDEDKKTRDALIAQRGNWQYLRLNL